MQDHTSFFPKLTTTDWAAEWIDLQQARRAADSAEHWNERAKTYHKSSTPNDYVKAFLKFADIQPGETIFDMGCGTGAISLPLAKAGHCVTAADFSQGMLNVLQEEAAAAHIDNINALLMSWTDDWAAHGLTDKSIDVACASRSIATADIKDSLTRLTRVAKRRCCITLPTGSSPRTDACILSAIGIENLIGKDFLYAFIILVQMGYFPEVHYIPSTRKESYANTTDAYNALSKMVVDAASRMLDQTIIDEALARLKTWLNNNLIENPDAGKTNIHGEIEQALILKNPRKITWGFIAWNIND